MFPIPSEQMLSFKDIADYWSGEIKPYRSQQQLRDHLSKAWWRGDLAAANGPSRVHLLRGLFAKCSDDIIFALPGVPEPPRSKPLEDGGMVVFFHPRVPLPNAQPDTWTDTNCAEAFNAIAEAWDEKLFGHLAFEVPFIVLTVGEFIRWLDKCGSDRPTFWRIPFENESPRQSTNETSSPNRKETNRYLLPKKASRGRESAYAWYVLRSLWPEGPPRSMSIRRITDDANKRRFGVLESDDYPRTSGGGLSETTVRRVLGLKK
jgi:hypothetical protein